MSISTVWRVRFIALLAQQLTELSRQRQPEHLLDRPVLTVSEIVLAAPRGAPQQNPVGGAITGAAKALRIDERLGKPDRVPIQLLPVAARALLSHG